MRYAFAAAALLIAAIAAVAYGQAEDFNAEQHERFSSALSRLKQLDAEIKEDLLRARFSLLNTYDDIESVLLAEAEAQAAVQQLPAFVDARARDAIVGAVGAYGSLADARREHIERFKSQNSVVANSRRYLPLAVQQLDARLTTDASDRALAGHVHELVRAVLGVHAGGDSATDAALASMVRIEEWVGANRLHPLAAAAAGVAAHARTLIVGLRSLDALITEILTMPTAAAVEEIASGYQLEVAGVMHAAQRYEFLLYAAAALLLAGLSYTLWQQRAANRHLERRVAERTAELGASEMRFRTLASAAPIGIFLTDPAGNCIYTNPYWQTISGLTDEEALGSGWQRVLHPDDRGIAAEWLQAAASGTAKDREFRFVRPDGQPRIIRARTAVVRGADGTIAGHVGTAEDITEHRRIAAELQQAQKLESVGRLAAGVAHEINTPVQFVNDSFHFLRDGIKDYQGVIGSYRAALRALARGEVDGDAALAQMADVEQRCDIEYLDGNMPSAIETSLDGLHRVATIVRSMKEFAHPDQHEMTAVDLNSAIQSTLTIARNEYKYVADLETEYGDLPPVVCFAGEFNQALLNIVVNAAHAIDDVVRGSGSKGRIRISTERAGDYVRVYVEDSGGGIPDGIRDKIFDPFFTTKPVGKGTGQGLAIARAIIVDKHYGRLGVHSRPGQGTTFTIDLPLDAAVVLEEAA